MNFIHIQDRVFDKPLAITRTKLDSILGFLGPKLGLAERMDAFLEFQAAQPLKGANEKTLQVTQDGIAIIPVQGTLMKRTSGLNALSGGCTSYETLSNQLAECLSSPQVKGILLDVDSPGGEVSGLFDLADEIYGARSSGKPIYAVSDDSAYSAAYAIASGASKLFVTRTAGVGSIGVVCCHVDQSAADKQMGVKYTYVHAGDRKVDGNPHEPLSDSAFETLNNEVQREYQMFVSLVARNRNITAKSVMATEAGVYFAEDSIPQLADTIGTFDDAYAALLAAIAPLGKQSTLLNSSATKSEVRKSMAKKVAPTTDAEVKTGLDIDAVKADDEMESPECAKPEPDDDDEDDDDVDTDDKKKSKAVKAVASVPVAATSDVKRIMNLCKLQKVDIGLAADFISKGFTLDQVIAALGEERSTKSSTTKINTGNGTPNQMTIDALQEQAETQGAGDPKKTLAAFKNLLRKNKGVYVAYEDLRDDAANTGATAKRKYLAELEARLGQKA